MRPAETDEELEACANLRAEAYFQAQPCQSVRVLTSSAKGFGGASACDRRLLSIKHR